jgi:ketosteroid isomerase-like protein
MSAEENTKIVQTAYGHFGRGDIPALLENLSDDVEWSNPENEHVPMSGMFKGKDGVGRFFSLVGENIEFHQFEPREFVAQGDLLAVRGHSRATIKASGKQVEYDFVHFFNLKNGKVTRFQEFLDTYQVAEAFKAAK